MIRRSLRTISAGLGLFAIMLAASSIEAQETNTVGNPQLKDFELPGTRTVPPANQQPVPAPSPPATTPPPPAATPPVTIPSVPSPQAAEPATIEAPAPRRPGAAPPAASRQAAPPPAADVPAEVPVGVPAPGELEQALPAPTPAAPVTEAPPAVLAAEPGQKVPWLYVGFGALLALLSVFALIAFKRSRSSADPRAEAEAAVEQAEPHPEAPPEPDPLFARRTPATAAPAAPAPAPAMPPLPSAAPADGVVSVSMRPRLELEFRADRAAATLTETSVQYELTIRNTGNRTARDIRIQVHMMNAAADQEKVISEFFAEPVGDDEPPLFAALAPKAEVNIRSGVTLPNERLREITIQGRKLFIPVVAFNVFYEWGDGRTGQTSMSYLVGREAPTPQEKMGPFRLDLGPRLYRSVGQRQGNLAKVV